MSELSLPEFIEKLSQIMPKIALKFMRRQVKDLCESQLTFPQFFVLSLLNSSQKLKMKDLADILKVTTANVTGIIERLVKAGYVKREYEPKDRRVIYVTLTFKAKDFLKKIEAKRRRILTKVFSRISEEDRKQYLKILNQIENILLEEEE